MNDVRTCGKSKFLGHALIWVLLWLRFLQSPTEQRPHKVSFYVEKEHAQEAIATLSKKLKDRGVR